MRITMLSLLGIVLFMARPASADFFPPADPKAGGIRDLMLIYLTKDGWGPDKFLPYVAYLGTDSSKKPRDWFYDSFLFLAFGGAPSGTTYIGGASNKADWEYYLDQMLFREGQSLGALDACIGDVEKTLGPRPTVPVILMIPYPSQAQKNFGDVDGDGKSEDFSQPADRDKAVRWCVDELLRRWKMTRFAHLKLWGFYWMNEGIYPHDEAVVRATADYVHQQGYGLHWIPYYSAKGHEKLPELGIDFAVLQPNYAFMEGHGRWPEEQRLCDTAQLARRFGMGIEIEMTAIRGRSERDNLWDYLAHGRDEFDGYMRHAVHAYYQGNDTIARLCYSEVAADRKLYEALYQFAKGTFQGRRERLAARCPYRIAGTVAKEFPDDGRKLTDGLPVKDWDASRLVGLTGKSPQIDLDLGEPRRIASVELRALVPGTKAEGGPAGVACPQCFDVAVSTTGDDWRQVGRGYRWYATPGQQITAGSMVAEFSAVDARFVAVTVHQAAGKMSLVHELLVEPAASLTEDAKCEVSPVPSGVDVWDGRLFDTCYQRGSSSADRAFTWTARQQAAIEVELREPRHLGLVRLHSPEATSIEQLDVLGQPDGATDWNVIGHATRRGDFWDLDAGAEFAKRLKLVATPKPDKQIVVDEVEVYPAANLALGRSYELSPAHPEQYGDPDRKKLTDGSISERGFGDGRMVGWRGQNVEVSVDLGQSMTIDATRLHTQGGGSGGVQFPPRVDVLVSADGRSWSWVAAMDRAPEKLLVDRALGHVRLQLGWMNTRFEPAAARFVMFRLAPASWMMLSEIEVLAGEKNVAQGCSYHLRPPPASSAPYADTTGRLTDGQYATGGFSRAVGWNTDRPRVVVDLGLATAVSEVSAHVLGGGPAGVHFPAKLSVSTSADGVRWEADQVAAEHPAENGRDRVAATLRVRFPPRPCRYVRLDFERRGWLMLDEVEVYGRW
jgi:hypothetical protein